MTASDFVDYLKKILLKKLSDVEAQSLAATYNTDTSVLHRSVGHQHMLKAVIEGLDGVLAEFLKANFDHDTAANAS
jgi:hypothetical protein